MTEMSNVEEELLELERRRCEAFDAFDLETLTALTVDDYVHVHSSALFDQNREQYFASLGTRTPGRYETLRHDLIVRDLGDVAIQAGPFHAKLWPDAGGDMREVIAIAIGVWRRTDAGWKLASFQVTKNA